MELSCRFSARNSSSGIAVEVSLEAVVSRQNVPTREKSYDLERFMGDASGGVLVTGMGRNRRVSGSASTLLLRGNPGEPQRCRDGCEQMVCRRGEALALRGSIITGAEAPYAGSRTGLHAALPMTVEHRCSAALEVSESSEVGRSSRDREL
jgi:hypothetical protein